MNQLELIHEALHHAGLTEQPMDPDGLTAREIDDMVGAACGRKSLERELAARTEHLQMQEIPSLPHFCVNLSRHARLQIDGSSAEIVHCRRLVRRAQSQSSVAGRGVGPDRAQADGGARLPGRETG